ncbi:MAG: rod-binding protein [Phycisphaerae bacterium]|nr:rod-binding protein [Phycisphaerae bacterium]
MNDIQALTIHRALPAAGAMDPKAVRAAKDFESVLLNKLMEAMQATVPESGLLEDGTSKQVQSIFWSYLSQDVADKGGMGLWKDLYRQLEGSTGVSPVSRMGILPMQERSSTDVVSMPATGGTPVGLTGKMPVLRLEGETPLPQVEVLE